MCFSATASFTGDTGILVIGAIAIQQSRNIPQKIFACIPLVFAVQQLCEGVLWLSFSDPNFVRWHNVSMYTFLVFAQCLWPILVPFSMLLFEKEKGRRKILLILFTVGLFTAIYLCACLLNFPVLAYVYGHHIKYELGFPCGLKLVTDITYMAAAVLSPFVSSIKKVRLFGWMLLGSYILTSLLYETYLASVWCFFAAILSLVIVIIIRGLVKESDATKISISGLNSLKYWKKFPQ